MKKHIATITLAATWFCVGCRTTQESSESTAEEAPKQVTGHLALPETMAENTYLLLLEAELAAGIKVPKETLHKSAGLLACRKDGVLKECQLYTRLMGDSLSERSITNRDLTAAFYRHAFETREELSTSQLLVADLTCEYIGKKSPPYNMEQVNCQIGHVRRSDEVVISNVDAERMTANLRTEADGSFSKKDQFRGSVTCQDLDGKGISPCLVRPYEGEALSSDVRELPRGLGNSLYRTLLRAARDHAMLSAGGKRVHYTEPSSVTGDVRCDIDLGSPTVYGGHICHIDL